MPRKPRGKKHYLDLAEQIRRQNRCKPNKSNNQGVSKALDETVSGIVPPCNKLYRSFPFLGCFVVRYHCGAGNLASAGKPGLLGVVL